MTGASSSASSGLPAWIWLVAAAAVAGIVVIVVMRSRRTGVDEA